MGKSFTLEYWITENWYVGKLRDVPGVFSQGKTLDELEDNIRDAYELMFGDKMIRKQLGFVGGIRHG